MSTMKKDVEKARLDADRTAKPKTRLVKHHPKDRGFVHGVGSR
jgi:hypothetical protein